MSPSLPTPDALQHGRLAGCAGRLEGAHGLSVEQWVPPRSAARDHYVRVIYKGYCLPFGHRVSLVKISERFFLKGQPGNAAYVLQRMFMIVREPVREFPETKLFEIGRRQATYYHRAFPFPVVRLPPRSLPTLPTQSTPRSTAKGRRCSGQSVRKGSGQEPFRFQSRPADLDGNRVRLISRPSSSTTRSPTPPWAMAWPTSSSRSKNWLTSGHETWRTATLQRQKVALAPSSTPGDTANEIESIVFGSETDGLLGNIQSPLIRPSILQASVRLPTIGALTGGAGNNVLHYDEGFLSMETGFGDGEVYAKLDVGGQALDFKSCGHRSGGFVQPSLAPTGLSRKRPGVGRPGASGFGAVQAHRLLRRPFATAVRLRPAEQAGQKIAGATGCDEMPPVS